MNQIISWMRNIGLRQIITVFLSALTFLVIPALSNSQSFQALADTEISPSDPYYTDKATIERVKDMAEDHSGDKGSLGNVGLKNIKKLGENIPDTADLIRRQRFDNDNAADIGDRGVPGDQNGIASNRVKEYNRD